MPRVIPLMQRDAVARRVIVLRELSRTEIQKMIQKEVHFDEIRMLTTTGRQWWMIMTQPLPARVAQHIEDLEDQIEELTARGGGAQARTLLKNQDLSVVITCTSQRALTCMPHAKSPDSGHDATQGTASGQPLPSWQ